MTAGGGGGDPNFVLDISSSWVERSLHVEFQLPRMLFHYYSGWAAGRLEESKLMLTQPSLAGSGAELGKIENNGIKSGNFVCPAAHLLSHLSGDSKLMFCER